jgi:hypothetical protein
MATTPNTLIAPQAPVIAIASLVAPAAITSRANIASATGLTALTPTSANGKRVDWLRIKSKGTSLAALLFVWKYDGTNAFLFDELPISAITPGNTVAAFASDVSYAALGMNMQSTFKWYVSVTVSQDLNVFAMGGDY